MEQEQIIVRKERGRDIAKNSRITRNEQGRKHFSKATYGKWGKYVNKRVLSP